MKSFPITFFVLIMIFSCKKETTVNSNFPRPPIIAKIGGVVWITDSTRQSFDSLANTITFEGVNPDGSLLGMSLSSTLTPGLYSFSPNNTLFYLPRGNEYQALFGGSLYIASNRNKIISGTFSASIINFANHDTLTVNDGSFQIKY